MPSKPHLLDHARAAVEHAARTLAELQDAIDSPAAARLGRQHRLLVDGAFLDLGRRQERLSSLYAAMIDASEEQVPACWQRFFACYDEYLEAARDARSRLLRDEERATSRARRNPGGGTDGRRP